MTTAERSRCGSSERTQESEFDMAHPAQRDFCVFVKRLVPRHFEGTTVLDVGSLDINGNNRYLFEGCEYMGIDVAEGPNVDLVTLAHQYDAPSERFETIISTECFEHDRYWAKSLGNIVRLLKRGGLLLFTCATTGREEHGTVRSDGGYASPLTSALPGWNDYYRNLSIADFLEVVPFEETFSRYSFTVDTLCHDLYFWGLKK